MDLPSFDTIEKNLQKRQKRYHYDLKRASNQAKKYLERNILAANQLREKSRRLLATAGLTGALLFSPNPAAHKPPPKPVQASQEKSLKQLLQNKLKDIVPHYPTSLDDDTANKIQQTIKESTGIPVKAQLEGQKLNHQIGYIGYEQHLKRFPSDRLDLHDEETVAGIAPGLGAWGYFAPSQEQFTTQDYLREKYYSVAQTLYLPNWNSDFRHLREWYKYRKILIVNPKNGQAVVTAIADAGPAKWTGKQFGGSPESMKALDLHKGPRKGLVVFLFIEDPNDQIPLGPVDQPINLQQ